MEKYIMITRYMDKSYETMEKMEKTNDLSGALSAASIYILDDDCILCNIYDTEQNTLVLCYQR